MRISSQEHDGKIDVGDIDRFKILVTKSFSHSHKPSPTLVTNIDKAPQTKSVLIDRSL